MVTSWLAPQLCRVTASTQYIPLESSFLNFCVVASWSSGSSEKSISTMSLVMTPSCNNTCTSTLNTAKTPLFSTRRLEKRVDINDNNNNGPVWASLCLCCVSGIRKIDTHCCWRAVVGVHQWTLKHSFLFVEDVHVPPLEKLWLKNGQSPQRHSQDILCSTYTDYILTYSQTESDEWDWQVCCNTCCSRFCFLSWMPSSSLLRLISSGFSALFL